LQTDVLAKRRPGADLRDDASLFIIFPCFLAGQAAPQAADWVRAEKASAAAAAMVGES
jgi:hypothetical protein